MAIGTPIMALNKALLALTGCAFLCLIYRKNPIGGRALETMNQNRDSDLYCLS
jgi:hypothetical protein